MNPEHEVINGNKKRKVNVDEDQNMLSLEGGDGMDTTNKRKCVDQNGSGGDMIIEDVSTLFFVDGSDDIRDVSGLNHAKDTETPISAQAGPGESEANQSMADANQSMADEAIPD